MEQVIIPVMPAEERKVSIAGPVTVGMKPAVRTPTAQDAMGREVLFADNVTTDGEAVMNAVEPAKKSAESAPAAQPAARIPVMQ